MRFYGIMEERCVPGSLSPTRIDPFFKKRLTHGGVGMLCIGFAGGSGSGKTTLVHSLAARFSPYTVLLSHDDYYKTLTELTLAQRTAINYDEPDAIDSDLFLTHIHGLLRGESIERPIYDFQTHERTQNTVVVKPAPVLLAEGILLFHDERLSSLFDLRVFVDTDADIRFIRRLHRDTVDRGRSVSSVVTQYQNTVKPMHEKYVEPERRSAHLIVPENGENPTAEAILATYIHAYLHGIGITDIP